MLCEFRIARITNSSSFKLYLSVRCAIFQSFSCVSVSCPIPMTTCAGTTTRSSESSFIGACSLCHPSTPSGSGTTRVVKFPGIYSTGNIYKFGINGNKFQSLKCIKKPIWKIPMKHITKIVLHANFWEHSTDLLT